MWKELKPNISKTNIAVIQKIPAFWANVWFIEKALPKDVTKYNKNLVVLNSIISSYNDSTEIGILEKWDPVP